MTSYSPTDLAAYGAGPTRAERLLAEVSAFLQQPIDRIIAALGSRARRDRG